MKDFRQQLYEIHKKAVQNAKPVVDCSPPRLSIPFYVKSNRLEQYSRDACEIRYNNEKLLKAIHAVYRSQGPTDCHIDKNLLHVDKISYEERTQAERDYIELKNKKIRKAIKDVKSEYSQVTITHEFLRKGIKIKYKKDWQKKNQLDICPECNKNKRFKRIKCFFEIQAAGYKIGRMEIEVYNDIVPKAAKNFVEICRTSPEKSYKRSLFYRIFPGLFCVTGDNINKTGSGGRSTFGESFPDENHILYHGCQGAVSMFKRHNNLNDAQFLITFKELPALDGEFMVIGRVTRGLTVLEAIEEFGTKPGTPIRTVKIIKCGVIGN